MGKSLDGLLGEMRNNPSGMRFAEVSRVASHVFGPPRCRGSSHGDGGKAKTYQVRQVLQAVARLETEKKP